MIAGRSICVLAVLVLAVAPAAAGPSSGGLASDNVEYVGHVPVDLGHLSGARVVGQRLFVAGFRGFSIYDIADPAHPALLSTTLTGFQFPNENVDTDGKLLLVSEETPRGMLHVYDVEDASAPVKLAQLEGAGDHTFSCVLRCRWAYGGYGTIVSLEDPARPRVVGDWGASFTGRSFDVTEVAPGVVITASAPLLLLDGRKDVQDPRIVARGTAPDARLMHAVDWPRGGRDAFVLVTGETPFSVRCDGDSGAFMTFDARRYRRTHTMLMIDEYRPVNGTLVDGDPPANAIGCSSLWFDAHPRFHDGGVVAGGFLEHGARFLEVDDRGRIDEVGWFVPAGGSVTATVWAGDDIVYSIDVVRGIDILRFVAQ